MTARLDHAMPAEARHRTSRYEQVGCTLNKFDWFQARVTGTGGCHKIE